MPVNPSYPGLYIEELPSSTHSITPAPTAITVFVGYVHPLQGDCAAKGLWKQAIRIFNVTDFETIFGGLYNNAVLGKSDVGYAVTQFFMNGGSDAYVVGLQPHYHNTDPTVTPAPTPEEITGAVSPALSGLVFTGKQLTDEDSPITVTIRRPLAAPDTTDLLVTYGSQVETYRAIKVGATAAAAAHKDFVATRLASSRLVSVAPSGPAGTAYPATFTITGAQQSVDVVAMTAPFADPTTFHAADFLEMFAPEGSLDKVDIFNLLVIPGVADSAIWSAGLHFAADKRAFFIMDPPEDASADGMGTAGLPLIEELVASDVVPKGPNGALYFPYLKSLDPVTGHTIHLPPSGFVAGIYARTDTNRGVWKAPAGLETTILNTTGVVDEGRMVDMRQGTLNQAGINVVRSFPNIGPVVWGARTIVAKNPAFEQWRYVPVRRTALFIEQSLVRNLTWVVFEPNDVPLWTAIRITIESFMLSLFRQSAFAGSTPSEAFQVKCDRTTTTEDDVARGIVNIVVGFRPLKPAEFVIIKIAQLAGQAQA